MDLNSCIDKARNFERLKFDEAKLLYQEADFHVLGELADGWRRRMHSEKNVTYIIDRNINYTNVCISGCKFCAFFSSPDSTDGYVISQEELARKIEETLELGGKQILFQGGLHPDLDISYYEDVLRFIKENFEIHIHGFSPPEICHIAKVSGMSVTEVIRRLKRAGLDSIPGGGAEILVDRVRKQVSPRKCSAQEWLHVMEEAHNQGLRTTATMMFGHLETVDDRLEHLFRLRELQDRTHGFTAFIPWPFQPQNTAINVPKATAVTYLRTLAISRIVLDNFENVQASWVTMGAHVAQLALFFGANDLGSTMIEENVVAAAGVRFRLSIEELESIIRTAGFEPRRRNMFYELVD